MSEMTVMIQMLMLMLQMIVIMGTRKMKDRIGLR